MMTQQYIVYAIIISGTACVIAFMYHMKKLTNQVLINCSKRSFDRGYKWAKETSDIEYLKYLVPMLDPNSDFDKGVLAFLNGAVND